MQPETAILVEVLHQPERAASLGIRQWDLLLRLARQSRVLSRLAWDLAEADLFASLPARVKEQLEAARALSSAQGHLMSREIPLIEEDLRSTETSVVLLKGAAYTFAALPPARGRLFSDVDILVPKAVLPAVESALLVRGWEAILEEEYDQRYYRTWMHELPPLRHRTRRTLLDVHHTILPESGRLRPHAGLLIEESVPVGGSRLRVLAPADMVLHSAAHIFEDGQLAGGIRDLLDLDDLMRHFGRDPAFWSGLHPRARQLGLERPLYYALTLTRDLFKTPAPEETLEAVKAGRPSAPVRLLMNQLTSRAIEPENPDRPDWKASLSRWMLFVRAHWLRMPPRLVLGHLARKWVTRTSEGLRKMREGGRKA